MIKIRFNNETFMRDCEFSKTAHNLVTLVGDIPENNSGFHTYQKDSLRELGNLTGFCTVYRKLENGVMFSNDGSVWKEPEPIDESERLISDLPHIPSVSLEQRIADLEMALIEMYEQKGV